MARYVLPLSLGVNRSGALEVRVDLRTLGGVIAVLGVDTGSDDAFVAGDSMDESESGIDEAVEGVAITGGDVGVVVVVGSTANRGAAGV